MRRNLITRRARALRKSMSGAEVILWTRLRGRDGDRPTFRRQHPMGSVILDFYCPSVRLAIEVDGSSHWEDAAQEQDEARDRWLAEQGVKVLRIPASRIYRELGQVMDGVWAVVEELQRRPPAPSTARSAARGPPPAASRGR